MAIERILIVDDFSLIRTLLKRALQQIGLKTIDEAANGKEALDMLSIAYKNNVPYDAVFLDWSMPEMDGFEVLKACRKHKAFKDLPIFMVTAESERDKFLKALELGVTDYIVKPFNVNIIKNKLTRLNEESNKSA